MYSKGKKSRRSVPKVKEPDPSPRVECSLSTAPVRTNKYSIGITTYIKRFDTYFKPLLTAIKKTNPSVEVIVTINGEYEQDFNEEYRRDMLLFLSEFENVFPIFFTSFRSLGKLWNNCLINSTNDHVLVLNDDVSVNSADLWDKLDDAMEQTNGESFKLNNCWSHVFLNRRQIHEAGWFDERLLSIGEEDGDMELQWTLKFSKPFPAVHGFPMTNHVEYANCLIGIKCTHLIKYSAFNHDFFYYTKWKAGEEAQDGVRSLAIAYPHQMVKCVSPTPIQYESEKYYWDNKHQMSKDAPAYTEINVPHG
jgi:hypothetical protein